MTSTVLESSSIPPNIPRILENQSLRNFLGKKIWKAAKYTVMGNEPDLDSAHRCVIIRTWSGHGGHGGQTSFVAKYGFTVKQWNNFERGSPLPREAAIQLVQKFPGLTLDWIHLGKWDTLVGTLRFELEETERTLQEASSGKRG